MDLVTEPQSYWGIHGDVTMDRIVHDAVWAVKGTMTGREYREKHGIQSPAVSVHKLAISLECTGITGLRSVPYLLMGNIQRKV